MADTAAVATDSPGAADEIFKGLSVRKLADKSGAVEQYDHSTRETRLVNPNGGAWPLLGVAFIETPPKNARIPMSWVSRGIREGWIKTEGDRAVKALGAPPQGKGQHVFFNTDYIIILDVEGPTRYEVVQQPGKYDDAGGAVCNWFFDARLVSRGK